jgi:ABC-2 type transport system ATP-binding protein
MNTGMPDPAIELNDVIRDFGTVRALDGLALTVPTGSVTVLLGPNGAGKTTTVRIITGALRSNGGTVRVLGEDPVVKGDDIRGRIGVVAPKPAMWDRLTGEENLAFTAEIYGVSKSTIYEAAERFGITYALDLEVGGYSTGMRTRLALARAVVHDPEILLLDEPTAGLDPESSRAVLELIRELAGKGRTIVMCTHLLHEAEGIADQVVLMGAGSAQASGHPTELAAAYMRHPKVVIDAENRPTLAKINEHPAVMRAEWNGALHVTLEDIDELPDLVTDLVTGGTRLTRVEPQLPTLEHLYFEMQRSLREDS